MTTRTWTWLFAALLAVACSRTGQVSARGSGGMGGARGGANGSAKGGTDRTGISAMGGDSGASSGGAGSMATDGAATGGAVTGGAATAGAATGGSATGDSAASGGVTGQGGATGGSDTTDAATDGAAGGGETAGALQPCNSSDGSGCSDDAFCMDTRSDSCSPDYMKDCTGFCAGRRRAAMCAGLAQSAPCPDGFACLPDARTTLGPYPVSVCVGADTRACTSNGDCPTGFSCVPSAGGSRCSPDKTVCEDYVTCPMEPPPRCPRGYARSTPDQCYGPCVPVELCGCTTNTQCGFAAAACDRKQERCYLASSPEPRCQLPFDFGSCDTRKAEYAFIDGECKLATGGCGRNDNRFSTVEECRARCAGVPGETACPDGRVESAFCIGCGAGGGCIRYVDVCTTTCATRADCPSDLVCYHGYCDYAISCV